MRNDMIAQNNFFSINGVGETRYGKTQRSVNE